jgi:hypothetical protein
VIKVAAPIESYDMIHAELANHPADGLIVHIGRAVDGGFQVIEVWESKEHLDRFNSEVMGPVVGKLVGDQPPPEPVVEEFDVRGLRIPVADINL